MTRILVLLMGAFATVVFAMIVLVIVSGQLFTEMKVPQQLKPYTEQELRGRASYIANGCVYCHTQQVRDPSFTDDVARGWGARASLPADYSYDKPHLLGTMRTGPDLFNVGSRLPDPNWQLLHLYQPRALVAWSLMPAFPFLFRHQAEAGPGETALRLPPGFAPQRGVIVPTQEAQDLVAYLLALKHDYPAPVAQAGPKSSGEAP